MKLLYWCLATWRLVSHLQLLVAESFAQKKAWHQSPLLRLFAAGTLAEPQRSGRCCSPKPKCAAVALPSGKVLLQWDGFEHFWTQESQILVNMENAEWELIWVERCEKAQNFFKSQIKSMRSTSIHWETESMTIVYSGVVMCSASALLRAANNQWQVESLV